MLRSALVVLMVSSFLCGCVAMAKPDHLSSGSSSGVIVGITRTNPGSNLSYGTVSGMPGFIWSSSSPSSQKTGVYTLTIRLDNGSRTSINLNKLDSYKIGDRVIVDDNGVRKP